MITSLKRPSLIGYETGWCVVCYHSCIQKRLLQENFKFDDAMNIVHYGNRQRNSEEIRGSSLTASLQKSDDVVHRMQGEVVENAKLKMFSLQGSSLAQLMPLSESRVLEM